MASQQDLAKLGKEAFAMLDEYYVRPAGRGTSTGTTSPRPPFPFPHNEDHHQPRAHPVINSKDAALVFGGIEIREYDDQKPFQRY
ncbi:hypothetical protein M0R45_021019 [Rubus argutus]|uniref:Uncharacterized protein n=1 Tax=Rubus argutus TaxID=59490 RepID=A0AAW1XAI9_RUBAR